MYEESIGSRKSLGDVAVLFHDGIYHLFHLVLPNHDYIAHAVSNDCIRWRRVENALFIGHPGSWDDSMLWTVHVSQDPVREGNWRMFYTGLSRRDHGRKQRIGLAVSDNLFTWTKSEVNWVDQRSKLPYELPGRPPQPNFIYQPKSCFPLEPDQQYYESDVNDGREWISWRDPYYFRDDKKGWLICAGRVAEGPIVRRGCIALLEEVSPGNFEARPPLLHPCLYDDIEVPNLIKIEDQYYLIGSIREDAKIRYWHAKSANGTWVCPKDNVLIGSGNYAGRVTEDESGFLFWSFFSRDSFDRTTSNIMTPPKRIIREQGGALALKSFEGFDNLVIGEVDSNKICPLIENGNSLECVIDKASQVLRSEEQLQVFLFNDDIDCFRLSTKISKSSDGKCGLVFRLNRETRDGYYISLDLHKGVVQIRAWGTDEAARGESMMRFAKLQEGYWDPCNKESLDLSLVAYGSYFELSIGGKVILSLADQTYPTGALGVYVETSVVVLKDTRLEVLTPPAQTDDHLAEGSEVDALSNQ